MMDQEVVTAAVAMEARVEAVVVHISVRYGRRLSWYNQFVYFSILYEGQRARVLRPGVLRQTKGQFYRHY